MTALALADARAFARPVPSFSFTPRVGSPRRAAILTALAAAAVREGNLRAVLILARTGRPRSLIRCAGAFRWLALAGLTALYPEANGEALRAALGCKPSTDPRQRAQALREAWAPDDVDQLVRAVIDNEDAQLTASWIWPMACQVAAAHTGADPEAVARPTGERGCQPKAISQARQIAVYLTMTEGDVNATAMAAASGLEKKTVRHAVSSIEDRRDEDAALDQTLTSLAAALSARLDEELTSW